MESMYILIPISILLTFVICYFLWWSGKNGQFDDLEGPAQRILMDDDDTFRQTGDETRPHEGPQQDDNHKETQP